MNSSVSFAEIGFMKGFNTIQMFLQRLDERFGEHSSSVLISFAIANNDLLETEIHIFNTQADTFHQAEPRSIKDICHNPFCSFQLLQDCFDFCPTEDNRNSDR